MAKQSVRMDREGFTPKLKTPRTKLEGLTLDFGVDCNSGNLTVSTNAVEFIAVET